MQVKIPTLSVEQMRQVDRLMVEDFGITIPQMMEIAGYSIAQLTRQLLNGDVKGKAIIAASGVGNNGGDALVAARYLTNWGANVFVSLTNIDKLHEMPRKQLQTLKKMGVGYLQIGKESEKYWLNSDYIIDGIIGYNLKNNPRGDAAKLIKKINSSRKPVLSVDVPSGLDAQTGEAKDPCIKATATIALSLPKVGSVKPQAQKFVGKLFVSDMSVPKLLYSKIGIREQNIFSKSNIVPCNKL